MQSASTSSARKLIHWATVIIALTLFPTGWAIPFSHTGHLTQSAWSVFVHRAHSLAGGTIAVLVLWTISLWLLDVRRGVALVAPSITNRAALLMHACLLAALIALSVTGTIAMYVSYGLAPVHRALSYLVLAMVVGHVLAALWHHIVLKDATLSRMLSWHRWSNGR